MVVRAVRAQGQNEPATPKDEPAERAADPTAWLELELLPELGLTAGLLVAVLVTLAYTLKTGTSPVPSSSAAVAAILALAAEPLERRLRQGRQVRICDLGAAWGGLGFALARRFPAAEVVGYELSPVPWLVARLRLLLRPTPNLRFERRDFMAAPLAGADLVTCYLGPGAMARLRPKLEAELPWGRHVVSNTFAMPGWEADRTRRADDLYAFRLYRYDTPAVPAPLAVPNSGDVPLLPFPP